MRYVLGFVFCAAATVHEFQPEFQPIHKCQARRGLRANSASEWWLLVQLMQVQGGGEVRHAISLRKRRGMVVGGRSCHWPASPSAKCTCTAMVSTDSYVVVHGGKAGVLKPLFTDRAVGGGNVQRKMVRM